MNTALAAFVVGSSVVFFYKFLLCRIHLFKNVSEQLFQPCNFLCLEHAALVVVVIFLSFEVSAKVCPSHKPSVMLEGIFSLVGCSIHMMKGWNLSRSFISALHIGPPMRSMGMGLK